MRTAFATIFVVLLAASAAQAKGTSHRSPSAATRAKISSSERASHARRPETPAQKAERAAKARLTRAEHRKK